MRIADFVITAAVVAGLSGPAMAQTPSTAQPVPNPTAQTNTYNNNYSSDYTRNWVVSGFIGTNFGSSRNTDLDVLDFGLDNAGTSLNFGGQIAYLGGGYLGGEFLADFSPDFELNNALFEHTPAVNSYMFNVIAAAPLGENHSYQPYASGGIGAVTLRSTIFTLNPIGVADVALLTTETASGSRFGWNLGGGAYGFSGSWGFRGDVRYYRTTTDNNVIFDLNNIGDGSDFTQVALSGISFWKANVGVAYRW